MERQQILERTVTIIRKALPQLADAELNEKTVINTDMGMDSMSFIMVICKLEAEFNIRIPDRKWSLLHTLGEVVDAIQKYSKN